MKHNGMMQNKTKQDNTCHENTQKHPTHQRDTNKAIQKKIKHIASVTRTTHMKQHKTAQNKEGCDKSKQRKPYQAQFDDTKQNKTT